MPKKYINCVEVTIKGQKMWRARLTFPFDHDLGYKPSPKDFYGKTAAEADAKRKNHKPEKNGIDKRISFVDYIRKEFIPKQEQLARAGEYSWQHYANRKWRLEKWLLDTEDEAIKKLAIRRVRLGSLTPEQVRDFFHTLLISKVAGENRRKLKDDFRVALKDARKRIAEPWREYFEDVEVPTNKRAFSQRQIFDWRLVCQNIIDETKPLRDRTLVAFAMTTLRRPSEIFALRWSDVDWQQQRITIRKAVVVTEKGMGVVDKTKNGVITDIALEPGVLRMLARLKQEVLPICSKCGEGQSAIQHRPPFDKSQRKRKEQHHRFEAKVPSEDDFIFTTERGKPLNKENFKRPWRAIKKNLGLPDGPGFYSLKHMANQALQERNVPVAAIATRMGHKNDEMARSTYRPVGTTEEQMLVGEFSKMLALAGPQEILASKT